MTSNKNTRTDNAEWEKSDTRRSTLCCNLRQMTETIHRRPGVGPDSRNLRGLLGCPPWRWHGCTWVWARVRAGVHLCVGAWVHGLHVYMRGCACVGAQVCGPPLYVCVGVGEVQVCVEGVWVWDRCRRECKCMCEGLWVHGYGGCTRVWMHVCVGVRQVQACGRCVGGCGCIMGVGVWGGTWVWGTGACMCKDAPSSIFWMCTLGCMLSYSYTLQAEMH